MCWIPFYKLVKYLLPYFSTYLFPITYITKIPIFSGIFNIVPSLLKWKILHLFILSWFRGINIEKQYRKICKPQYLEMTQTADTLVHILSQLCRSFCQAFQFDFVLSQDVCYYIIHLADAYFQLQCIFQIKTMLHILPLHSRRSRRSVNLFLWEAVN